MEKIIKIINNKFFLGIIIPFIMVLLLGLFAIDIGINSKYFIKKSFNSAFTARQAGDCELFIKSVNRDVDEWKNKCEYEKQSINEPIRDFSIKTISYSFFSDRAFLQVDLTRNNTSQERKNYSINYEMRKIDFVWKIDQEIKE